MKIKKLLEIFKNRANQHSARPEPTCHLIIEPYKPVWVIKRPAQGFAMQASLIEAMRQNLAILVVGENVTYEVRETSEKKS